MLLYLLGLLVDVLELGKNSRNTGRIKMKEQVEVIYFTMYFLVTEYLYTITHFIGKRSFYLTLFCTYFNENS